MTLSRKRYRSTLHGQSDRRVKAIQTIQRDRLNDGRRNSAVIGS